MFFSAQLCAVSFSLLLHETHHFSSSHRGCLTEQFNTVSGRRPDLPKEVCACSFSNTPLLVCYCITLFWRQPSYCTLLCVSVLVLPSDAEHLFRFHGTGSFVQHLHSLNYKTTKKVTYYQSLTIWQGFKPKMWSHTTLICHSFQQKWLRRRGFFTSKTDKYKRQNRPKLRSRASIIPPLIKGCKQEPQVYIYSDTSQEVGKKWCNSIALLHTSPLTNAHSPCLQQRLFVAHLQPKFS